MTRTATRCLERAFGLERARKGALDAKRALDGFTTIYVRLRRDVDGRVSRNPKIRAAAGRRLRATLRMAERLVLEFQMRAASEATHEREKKSGSSR